MAEALCTEHELGELPTANHQLGCVKCGRTYCPQCERFYTPVLGERKQHASIQDEFPEATSIEREQLTSGLCSPECWNAYLGWQE